MNVSAVLQEDTEDFTVLYGMQETGGRKTSVVFTCCFAVVLLWLPHVSGKVISVAKVSLCV